MPTTPNLGLRKPAGTDGASGPTAIGNLADDVDSTLGILPNPPTCQVRQVGAQTFLNGVTTQITFDTEDTDTSGMHSPSTNPSRITAVKAGRYQLSGKAAWASNATGIRSVDWLVNGVQVNGGSTDINAVNGFSTRLPAPTISVFLNVGDYVELAGFQNSGASLNTATAPDEQSFALVTYMGAT